MSIHRVLFTSESVSSGHPDKVCDAVSDAILDACLAQDPGARVAVECLVKGKEDGAVIVLAGEVTVAGATPDYAAIARGAAADIGYTAKIIGMDATSAEHCDVQVHITPQSPDISAGVSPGDLSQGAGDQGLMFGFATDESEVHPETSGAYMPLSALLSSRLTLRLAEVREQGILPWARPDAKSQVTMEYVDGVPTRADVIVVAIQHRDMLGEFPDEAAEQAHIRAAVREHVIDAVIPAALIDDATEIIVNGTGRFCDPGGPYADAGLTGRKIIVDTYGGMGRHGGGAFSGKDPSKVDRSAAYAARWAAKHVVAAGLAKTCEIQLAYAIGVADPVSIRVKAEGASLDAETIAARVGATFDFRPAAIIRALDLLRPIYRPTAAGGHFGRTPTDAGHFSWEALDTGRLENLRRD